MRSWRLAYVVNAFPKLSETFVAQELAELLRRGAEVLVLSLNRPEETVRHGLIDEAGLARRTRYQVADFERELRVFRPDLLHAHFATEPTAAARELARTLRLPFTFTAHGYDVYRRPPADFRERAKAASAVVTVSRANSEYIQSEFGVAREQIFVVPSGVDTDRFRPGERRTGVPQLLCVARLKPVKNLMLLLRACRQLADRGVDFRCRVIGEGPARGELEAARASLGLTGTVMLAGAAEQDRVAKCWRQASVGALSSLSEGMPVSLMEAASSGVPVVAPRVGGIPELVVHGETGLLFEPGDETGMASALETLVSQRALREALGANARQRALERFSIHNQIDALLALWRRILGRGVG